MLAFRAAPLLVLALGALFSSCSATPDQVSAIDKLERCPTGDGPVDSYCGKVEVWENRTAQSGRRIALNVVVLPGVRRDASAEPMFFLAGGPGQGAAQIASQIQPLFRRILIDRDIVLVDQRGTGDSNSLACVSDEELEGLEAFDLDPPGAMDQFRTCLEEYDADPSLYTTSIAMDDLDEVRQYLGYGRIHLYGGSYGTRAAIEFVRRHPDSTRSVILDGVAPPDMSLPLYMARDGQRAFDLLAADCAADPDCAARFPDLANRFRALLDRLEAQPQRMRVTHPRTGVQDEITISRPLVAGIVFGALYAPETSALLPFLIERAEQGDFQGLLALGFTNEGVAEQISMGMRYSVVCAEDAPRVTEAAIERETAGTFMGSTYAQQFLAPCDFWPRGQVETAFYEPFDPQVPALIFSGELDPVTPPRWGEQIAGEWTGSRHIVVPGIGHGAVSRGCVIRIARDFFNQVSSGEGSVDDLDASCVEKLHRAPFFLGYSGPVNDATGGESGPEDADTAGTIPAGGKPGEEPGGEQ